MCEILPKDPINAVVPLIHVPPTESKYNVMPITEKKPVPKRKIINGKMVHECPLCNLQKVSWGVIDSHLKSDHCGLAYKCHICQKKCCSLDGMCQHMSKCGKS